MTLDELQWRRLVVSTSGVIYWAGVVILARRIRRRIGRSPNLKPRGSREKLLWFGWFLVILVWIGQPWLVRLTGPTPGLALLPGALHPWCLALGLTLVALGYAGTLWTYAAMGDTWRIGIVANEKTRLVTSGPFRWVRHPIYAFQMVMLSGAALLLPTVVSLVALGTHYLCVRIKARDEEQHLTSVQGRAYRDYLSRTGRLLPRLLRRPAPQQEGNIPSVDV